MKKVLIVEDDPTVARIYQGLIRMEGAEADVAADGELAIQSLQLSRPDLVLLDLMLPKKNGIEVLKHIRSKASLSGIPVIVFTNAKAGSLAEQARLAGATQCVIKAETRPKQLMEIVRGHLTANLPAAGAKAARPERETVLFSEGMDAVLPVDSVPGPQSARPEPTLRNLQLAMLNSSRELLGAMRKELQIVAKIEQLLPRQSSLEELCRSLQTLTIKARSAGMAVIAQLSAALGALAEDLAGKPSNLNPSSIRTLAQGLDCVDSLFTRAAEGTTQQPRPHLIMILDDEAVSRRVISAPLERAGLRTLKLADPHVALELFEENSFDLVFLDVSMPDLDGFEFCRKLRACQRTKSTPIVFVTSLTHLESRAQSIMSGGNDFIGKPLLAAELTVKALLHVLSQRALLPPPDCSVFVDSSPTLSA
jgi:CheY-like chemotaxis protein